VLLKSFILSHVCLKGYQNNLIPNLQRFHSLLKKLLAKAISKIGKTTINKYCLSQVLKLYLMTIATMLSY